MDKAKLFARLKAEVKAVEIKALGEIVKFRVLSGKARDAFHAAIQAGDQSRSHFEASIVAAAVVDDNGAPVFSGEDVAALQDETNNVALSEMATAAMRLNKIGSDAQEDAVKN